MSEKIFDVVTSVLLWILLLATTVASVNYILRDHTKQLEYEGILQDS